MANAVSVKVEGLAEIRATLQRLGRSTFTQDEVLLALRAGGQIVKQEAVLKAPMGSHPHRVSRRKNKKGEDVGMVQPGNLKRNLRVAKTSDPRHFASIQVGFLGRGPAFYWRFLEFGTIKMRPRPFMRSAFEQSKGTALAAMIERLRSRLEKVARKQGV